MSTGPVVAGELRVRTVSADDYVSLLALDRGWYHARTPTVNDWSTDKRPGSLAVHGGPYAFKDDECLAMLLRKQDAIRGVWQSSMDFEPTMTGEEAGAVVWWSKYACGSVGIRGVGDGRRAEGKELVFRASNPDKDEDDVSGRVVSLQSQTVS